MKNLLIATLLVTAATSAIAEPRFYTEYKNELRFRDKHYIDNTAVNNIRAGVQGSIFYFEVGPSEHDGEYGSSYETGYKYKFVTAPVELKGKLEGYQFDSYEGRTDSKRETEIRYYFN